MNHTNPSFNVGDYVVAISHPYDRVCRITQIDPDGYFYCDDGSYVNPSYMRIASNKEREYGFRLSLE